MTLADWTDGSDPYAATAELLEPDGRYAISDAAWAMHVLALQQALPDSTYVSMTSTLPMLRAIKDADELGRLAAAGSAADARFEQIAKGQFAGRRESEIAADLAGFLRDHGHSEIDFTVVGSGPNGANPHHEFDERVIEEGDMIVLDFGGIKDGYGSDTTRTVHVGEPTDEEREVHELVRRAQQAASRRCGRASSARRSTARRKVIADAGYGEYFIHRTGHGIGLTTHEPPYMIEGDTNKLQPGMCFSIEPGVYLPGRFGVRIEDIVTVTAEGGQRFNTPHELQIVADMSVRGAAFLGIGAMVGAGIFALLGEAGAVAGSAVWLSFLIAGVVSALLGYTVVKLGVRYPSSGGIIAYLMQGFGNGRPRRNRPGSATPPRS